MAEQPEQASILVLGSGTSVGVPMIGCHCKTCTSTDPKDKRLRPSVLVRTARGTVLIDTSPDFRYQALHHAIERIDGILYTHAHADHILGLDDLRPFNFMQKSEIPIYGSAETLAFVTRTFWYVFEAKPTESSRPRLTPHAFEDGPFSVANLCIHPIRAAHGRSTVHGYRFGDCAYLTDHSDIPPESKALLQNLDVLFLDALRTYPHPTHSTVEQSLRTVEELKPKRAFFTHISHDILHEKVQSRLPAGVELAYDGLEIFFDGSRLV